LKRGLDALYAAMSLGNRVSILARLKEIVPQFSYENSDQDANQGKMPFRPLPGNVLRPVSPLGEMPGVPYRTWQVNPAPGPVSGGPGD
jgi:hypothetical protein